MTIPSRIMLFTIVLLVAVAAGGTAFGQTPEPPQPPAEGGEAPADSLGGAAPDSMMVEGQMVATPVAMNEEVRPFQNTGPGTRPRVAAQEPEFHPTYKLTYDHDGNVGTWGHDFTMNYALSQRLKFNSSATITTREDEVLNRENRQESWATGLNYDVTEAVGMSVRFNRSFQKDTRNPAGGTAVTTSREKETMDFSTSYRKTHFSGFTTALSASAGLEKNDYADITSNGSTQNVSATLGYDIFENLGSSFTYSGKHSVLDSKQGDFESTDESVSHSMTADFDYEWAGHTLSAGARRSYSQTQYPKEGQTEERDQEGEGLDFTTTFSPFEGLGMEFGYDYSRSQLYYLIEENKDSDATTRQVNGKIDYQLGGATMAIQLQSKRERNEKFSSQTGDTYSDSFGGSINHTFNSKLSGMFRGTVSLVSFHYDDIEANDQDRDLLNQDATLSLTYKPRTDITGDITLRIKESQLIYIRTTRTGDNKTTNTYSIQPSIRKNFSPNVSVTQKYELSADYTFYTFDRDSNSLIRNFGVTTDLSWKLFGQINTTFSHKYRGQDEGSYVEEDDGVERYGKNSERDDHTLSMTVRYKLFSLIDLEVTQDYSVSSKWLFEGGNRRLSWEKHDTSLQGKASMSYELENGTDIRASVTRTLRDAPNITERQEDMWKASISLERTF